MLKTARMCRARKGNDMAKLVFGMNQSLDGYVDHLAFAPSPTLFRHFIDEAQGQAGSVYGRQMYETMRYWDDDQPEWNADERAFAAAWRTQPKWVVSRSLNSVGPSARLPGLLPPAPPPAQAGSTTRYTRRLKGCRRASSELPTHSNGRPG